jgi:hypothetical protein
LKIPFSVAFSPHKVDEQGFMILMNKNATKWATATASASVVSSTKPKTALKALSKLLQA